MMKELQYFTLEGQIGGNQEIFSDFWMRIGGCGAVVACDMCVYMDLYKDTTGLYPYDLTKLDKHTYETFALVMKPFLKPRWGGIDTLDLFMEGFGRYLEFRDNSSVRMTGFDGHENYDDAAAVLKKQIDLGMPVAYLNLHHKDPALDDFVWHWFLLTGYEETEEGLQVQVTSYGKHYLFDFKNLWESGYDRKGGMVLFEATH